MSFAYLVIYQGQPQDPEAFLKYYLEHHIPIVWTFPKVRTVEVERGVDGGDVFMIGRFTFDSLADLNAAIHSPEREVARQDMKNFPPFTGTIHRQAVEILTLPRGQKPA